MTPASTLTITVQRIYEDNDEPFEEKMKRLTAKLEEQFAESAKLEAQIRRNLKELGYGS
jgi:type I restriction enzyme M protein